MCWRPIARNTLARLSGKAATADTTSATSIQRSSDVLSQGARSSASSDVAVCAQAAIALRLISAAKGCVASITCVMPSRRR